MREESSLILMVEADESLARVVTSYLLQDGYRVLCFPSLRAATNALRTRLYALPPDLVILDLDSLQPHEFVALARLTQEQGDEGTRDESGRDLRELISLSVMLFAGDNFQTRWARRYQRARILYKPFAIHELRREVGSSLTASAVGGAGQFPPAARVERGR